LGLRNSFSCGIEPSSEQWGAFVAGIRGSIDPVFVGRVTFTIQCATKGADRTIRPRHPMKARILSTFITLLVFLIEANAEIAATYSSSGSFVVPPGVTEVSLECWGGGGKGGSRTSGNAAYGGGGGAYARSVLTVVPGNTYTVTVGNGSTSTSPRR
jgi:hypothetical protein